MQPHGCCSTAVIAWKTHGCVEHVPTMHLQITTSTVIGLVETAAVPKGEWLLQTAAASGLGRQVRLQTDLLFVIYPVLTVSTTNQAVR